MTDLDPLLLFRLDGQVAIVTGASSGLGDRFARVLHAVGAQVVVAARRLERLETLAAELPGTFPVAVDLSDEADRERLVAETLERFGRVDVLVNNAGIGHAVSVENETIEDFRDAMLGALEALENGAHAAPCSAARPLRLKRPSRS